MLAKVKRLRHQGKRLSDREIGAAPAVDGEVKVYGVGTTIWASVTDPNRQVGDPDKPGDLVYQDGVGLGVLQKL